MKNPMCFLIAAIMFWVSAITLSGCAAPKSSGVLIAGKDTYQIAVSGADMVPDEAKTLAYTEANQECEKQGKAMLVQNERKIRFGTIELTFKCLNKDAPEFQQQPVKAESREVPTQK